MSIYQKLNYYYKILNRSTFRIACPHCKVSMLPKLFEKHCSSRHNINGKNNCVWCRQLSWTSGEKKNHVIHLIDCFKDFSKLKTFEKVNNFKTYRLLTMDHKYTEKDFFGHELTNTDLASSEFDCVWPLDVSLPTIHFPDENLNLAASYLQKYLETTNTHDWMHIMVRVGAFKSFIQAIKEDGGNSRMLEFSCWCDGGHNEKAEHRQHRHMITVSHPKNHFKLNVWPKITPENKPFPNFKCKELKEMEGPLHFINTMGYLSKRKSRCNFSFENRKKKTPDRNNHFYIYKTLPKTYKLHLVQFWDGGINDLLYVEKFQNVSIERLTQGKIIKLNSQWKQKIKEFYAHERGLVLNVSKGFLPIDQITPSYFRLVGGQKLYFKFSQENKNLDSETWIRKQVMGGNCFYDIIEENVWTPSKKVQEVLNFHMPVLNRKKELEIENADLKEKLEKKKNSNPKI